MGVRDLNARINIVDYDFDVVCQLIKDVILSNWDVYGYEDLNAEEYSNIIVETFWKEYVAQHKIDMIIDKIKRFGIPDALVVYMDIILSDREYLYMLADEVRVINCFRFSVCLKRDDEFLGSYVYNYKNNIFSILDELVEPGFLVHDLCIPLQESNKINTDLYGFNAKLLGLRGKLIKLYTAQPEERVLSWFRDGYIPDGIYFTSSIERARYYFEKGDIIDSYMLPDNKLIVTYDGDMVKEYVTIDRIYVSR